MTKQPLIRIAFSAMLLAALLLSPLTAAQPTTFGTLGGTITDPQGKPIANAEVELLLNETVLKTASAADGTYRIPMTLEQLLPPNSTTLRAAATINGTKMIGIDDESFSDLGKPLLDFIKTPRNITLRPTYRTEIIAHDEQGNPVEGAKVEALIDFERGFKAPRVV